VAAPEVDDPAGRDELLMEESPAPLTPAAPDDADDQRTGWLIRYEAWLRTLARLEIDTRFQGKFSASDAVQQTLLEAWRAWDNFRGHTEAERVAWLRGILAHQLAHLARHFAGVQKRDVAREQSLDQSLAQSSQRLDQLLAGRSPSLSAELVRAEQRLQLIEVLDRLPDDYRQVILLRNLQELPFDEIARQMQRRPGAVRMLWVRALARLRDEIEPPP
jgi:RNA polymerase sigma-70 factor (ECF subfamily)